MQWKLKLIRETVSYLIYRESDSSNLLDYYNFNTIGLAIFKLGLNVKYRKKTL